MENERAKTGEWERRAFERKFKMRKIISIAFALLLWGMLVSYTSRSPVVDPEMLTIEESLTSGSESIRFGYCTFGNCPVASTVRETPSSMPGDTSASVEISEADESDSSVSEQEKEPAAEFAGMTVADSEEYYESVAVYSASYFRNMGELEWNGWTWKWYSERVLPGTGLHIPGRYTDDEQRFVRDEDGYICLASDVLDRGTVVDTPFGSPGRVYDNGVGDDSVIDVYVGW